MLDVSVAIPAGSSFDAADKSGVASLNIICSIWCEGLSEDDIARGMADIGAHSAAVSTRTGPACHCVP